MSNQDQVTSIFVPTSNLLPSPTNPRKRFDEEKIQGMADTMTTVGVLQPLVVRNFKGKKGKYEIVAGETRWRAATAAGLDQVPVIIRELTDQQVIKIQVIENLQRNDLHALEEAGGFKALLDQSQDLVGYTIDDLAKEVGKSRTYIYDSLKLLELPEDAVTRFYDGELNRSTALMIARLDEEQQAEVLETISDHAEGISVREFKEVVDNVVQTSARKKEEMAQLEHARGLAAKLEAERKAVVMIDSEQKRQEWAKWGPDNLTWGTKDGYTGDKCTFSTPPGFSDPYVVKILAEDELPGLVYLVFPSSRIARVFLRGEAQQLCQKKLDAGLFVLEPLKKSEHDIKREAKKSKQEIEQARRSRIVDDLSNSMSNIGWPVICVNGVLIELIKLIYENYCHHNTQTKLRELLQIPHLLEGNLMDLFLKRDPGTFELLTFAVQMLSANGIEPSWSWESAKDNTDEEEYQDLTRFCALFGIDPTDPRYENPLSTPPSAAQAQESNAPKNQAIPVAELAGELSPDEAALIEPAAQANETAAAQAPKNKFEEIKAKALARKQKKESAKADELNGTAAAVAA